MINEAFTYLNGVSEIGQPQFEEQVTLGICDFFNWGFLNVGGFTNITLNTSGAYGNNASVMRAVADPNYPSGTVYEGFRINWVWESNIDYHNQPIQVSGTYINGTFLPLNTTGSSGYKVNYPLGRIIFNSPLPVSSVVQTEYSYKNILIETAEIPWFRQLEFNSLRLDDISMQTASSGSRNTLGQSRVQMPAIIVEVVPGSDSRPANIGGGHFTTVPVLFHVFGEWSGDTKTIRSVLEAQKDKTIYIPDRVAIANDGVYPLFYDGTINPSGMSYPQLLNPKPTGYRSKRALFKNIRSTDQSATNFYMLASVRCDIEVDSPEF